MEKMKEHDNRVEKVITHHNNFKLALLEETLRDAKDK